MKTYIASLLFFLMAVGISFAVDRSYPVSEVNLGAFNTIYNLNITGFASGSALNIYQPNGAENEDWRINYISDGVYEIENSTTGSLITVGADNIVRIANKVNDDSQRWRIVGVTKDFLGEYLYYKIVNINNSKALTFEGSSVLTKAFTSADNQLWRLDLDGLEGFGALSKVNEGIKASTIGGLLGPTVFVSNLTELRNELGKSGPLTVVLTENLDCINQGNDIRIDSYKTLIGSFTANTLTDARLVTNYYGWAYPPENPGPPSDNIVVKNLTFPVKGREDVIVLQVYSGKNVWIDHNTFYSTLTKSADEVGKFVWINTSSDGPDKFRNPDFITLSYNVLRNRYWCVAYGTQNSDTHEDRTTVAFNVWDSNVRRTPQIGNGTMHTYNNFNVNNSSSVDNAGYANVITGAGSFVFAEANRFENFKKESSGFWDEEYVMGTEPFRDEGSYTNKSESGSPTVTPYLWSTTKSVPTLHWSPRTNYSYKVLKAYDPSGQYDAKVFTNTYSGSKNTPANFKYVTDFDVANFVVETVAHPILINAFRDCNGDIDGSATLDECGICTGGNTGVDACVGAMQGEDFCEAIGVFEDRNSGYASIGYINFDNQLGSNGKWYLHSESAGNKTLGIRFANGGTIARSMSIAVNGDQQTIFNAEPTASWTDWQVENIVLNLKEGANEILLTATTTEGGPNVDVFIFESDGLQFGGCEADCYGTIGGAAFIDNCNTCVEGNTGVEACEQDCEGTWGGTTLQDECGVCLTDANILPCSGSLEAETACDIMGVLEDKNFGFEGTGYVNTDNQIGSYVSWVINSTETQTATISFRYANGGATSRDGALTVNGTVAGNLTLPSTGGWEAWKYASVNLELKQGANEIITTATTADGLANIDVITFSEGVSDAQCGLITSVLDLAALGIAVSPNPTSGLVQWDNESIYTLKNTTGVTLQQGKATTVDLSEYSAGIYLLEFESEVVKILKK